MERGCLTIILSVVVALVVMSGVGYTAYFMFLGEATVETKVINEETNRFDSPGASLTVEPIMEPMEATPEPRNADTTLSDAFYHIIKEIYAIDPGLNHEIKYVAVDIEGVYKNVRWFLYESLRQWAATHDYELIIDNYTGLVESGYIVEPSFDGSESDYRMGFIDGILLQFNIAAFNGEKLIVDAQKYRSPRGSVGATFTARFEDSNWIFDEPDGIWMS